jgi:hypothetical protein
MSEIVEFLKARLDEDETIARDANTSPEMVTGIPRSYASAPVAIHIARHHPERVLREVEAKRRIVHEYEVEVDRGPAGSRLEFEARHGGILDAYRASLRILAAAYSDHPDYRQEWAL